MTNKTIARYLRYTSDLIELSGGNPFRARSFSTASRAIDRLTEPAEPMIEDGSITAIQGIGKGLARDLGEFLQTGAIASTDEMIEALPPGLPDVLRVKGLGVKKVRVLWEDAGVESLADLEAAAASGRLASIEGFGAKSIENILRGVEEVRSYMGKAHLRDAVPVAMALREALRAAGLRSDVAGQARRHCNVVDQIDLLTTASAEDVIATLDPHVSGEVSTTESGSLTALLEGGLKLAVHETTDEAFGRALWEHTGPAQHIEAVTARFGAPADVSDEADLFAAANLAAIPPPLRDDPRWIDAAAEDALPALIRMSDIRGTVHNHTTASDGANSLREMCDAARERGLTYFGVCDHSRSLQVANGLSIEAVLQQIKEVAALNQAYNDEGVDFRVFSGSEVDILNDGSMDFPDDLLEKLDVVVASVHTGFNMTEEVATQRIIRAVQNVHVDILGHPTGRLLLRREGYPIDHRAVIDACAEHVVAIELNANPWRLDVDWSWLSYAVECGVMISINPDAHSMDGLDDIRWGVASAQKGGLTAEHSLMSLGAAEIANWLHGRR